MSEVLKSLLLGLINILWFSLLAQVVLSWLVVAGVRNDLVFRVSSALGMILEPLLRPIRRVVPRLGMIDLTYIGAFIVLFVVKMAVEKVL